MDFFQILMAIFGGGASAAIVGGIVQVLMFKMNRKAVKEDSAVNQDKYITGALRLILQDRIKYLGRKHLSEGSIEMEDLRDLIEMHRAYHDDLSGNGLLDNVMSQVKNLQIRD